MAFAYVSFPYCLFIVFFKLRMKKTTRELFNVILFSLCCLVLNSPSIILAIIFLDMNQILNQKQPELELFIEKPWRSCPELRAHGVEAAPKGYAIFANCHCSSGVFESERTAQSRPDRSPYGRNAGGAVVSWWGRWGPGSPACRAYTYPIFLRDLQMKTEFLRGCWLLRKM